MVHRWIFTDPAVSETYEWAVNPNSGGSPSREKNIQYENTSAPDGKTLIFEGQDRPLQLEWSGVILSQSQYDTLITWFEKRRQIRLEDDLGRTMWIYITAFTPSRRRAVSHPYKHDYNMRATVLDWI